MTSEWFEKHRGITKETLDAFGVRFNENEVVFPYPTGEKTRSYDLDSGKRHFKFTKGHSPALFMPPPLPAPSKIAFLCEGETDTMKLWQELEHTPVYGLGGVNTWRKEFVNVLNQFDRVYVILDNDQDYNVQNIVNDVWLKIRKDLGAKAKRIRLPEGVKDVCEFFEMEYDIDSLKKLVKRGNEVSRFKLLDLTKDPEPVNWLMEDLIALGDVTLEAGKSGLGKSWFGMGLAVAVADGHSHFLGKRIAAHGPVMIVDEENPEDVVKHRMRGLGLRNPHQVRYIWNNGVRLDRNPDVLLEEALDIQPKLIVLDSLTRIHSGEENAVGDMAPLLNDAIQPLARETGAAVLLVHHHDKSASGPRGSSDITASVDGILDVFETAYPSQFKLRLSKSRRRMTGEEMIVKINDTDEGTRLTAAPVITDLAF